MMGKACDKCSKLCGALWLLLGLALLARDLGYWTFWGVQWYTALILLFGLGAVAGQSCKACQKM